MPYFSITLSGLRFSLPRTGMGAAIVTVGICYGILAWAGITLTKEDGRIAAVWFPNAMLVVVLLRNRREFRPWFAGAGFIGNMCANAAVADGAVRAAGLASANMLEVGLILAALAWRNCPRPDFTDNAHVFQFAIIALLASCASGLVAALVLESGSGMADMLNLWWTWARADALGLVLLVPSLSIILDALEERRSLPRDRWLEAALLFCFGTALSVWTFWQTDYPFLFLDAPIVLLYAIRLGPVGNALAIINLAIVASAFTVMGHGPISLVQGGLHDKLMVLQVFLASSFAIGLPTASLIRESRGRAEARAAFLANMSHDIRTPMNGVLGFTDLLLMTQMTPAQRGYAERIESSGRTMMSLLNDILDLSKIESGKLHVEPAPFDLRSELAELLGMLDANASSKGLALDLDMAPDVPRIIETDQLRLRQVLLNLVGNAIKFTDRGEVRIVVRREMSAGRPALRIEVSDTGIGITQEGLGRIFTQYEQAERSTHQKFGGTGLGLAISRQLVGLMGGNISVSSIFGKGTTFTVTLPVVEDVEHMEHGPDQLPAAPLQEAA